MARSKSGSLAGDCGRRAAARFAWLMALTLAGCTSVDSAADRQIAEQRLPRPAAIVVHDFAVAPEEVDPGRPLAEAHARASDVEERIRAAQPGIADVVVHTEP